MVEPAYTYKATVTRWVDGDTVDLRVDCGFHITVEARFRLYGVDTPERGRAGYDTATRHNNTLAGPGTEVVARTYKAPDKYGRFLADLWVAEVKVNDSLLASGLAVPYFGGTKA